MTLFVFIEEIANVCLAGVLKRDAKKEVEMK